MSRYKIADLIVEMEPSGRTKAQAEPYRIESEQPCDIRFRLDPQAVLKDNPQLRDADSAEYMASGVAFARRLLNFDGFQLHSSSVVLDGYAFLFSAPCGTGKSTHTEKWHRLFGAQYLNDDKPALRRLDSCWMAYGTPWSGKHDISTPVGVPIGGIAFLERGDENRIERLSPADAVPLIVSQCLCYLTAERMSKQLMLMDRLLAEVPVWRLICKNEDAAAIVSHEEMTKCLK